MEWTTVTVIISLVGLGGAIIKPIVSLTRSITELTIQVKGLRTDMDKQTEHNREAHNRMWVHNGEQDGRLDDHERRIDSLEHKA